MDIAIKPAITNLSAETVSGGVCSTIMRAEVKALPHINENTIPMETSSELKLPIIFRFRTSLFIFILTI